MEIIDLIWFVLGFSYAVFFLGVCSEMLTHKEDRNGNRHQR